MNTFRFNFSTTELESNDNKDFTENEKSETSQEIDNVFEAKEIFPSENIIERFDDIIEKANVFFCGDRPIGYVSSLDVEKILKEEDRYEELQSNIRLADSLHSDLIEGKYEGGLKIWECTADLADYICENELAISKNTTVLDLGCGTGILGIIALLSGARVHFQDYNEEVLIASTIPNILLNSPDDEKYMIKDKCNFFSGDWGSLLQLMISREFQYDFILTSETIYNPKNYCKIYNLIKSRLKTTGCAFVAAKSYYFGVGGSTKDFIKFVIDDGAMNCEVCLKIGDGVPREILKLSFK